MICSNFQGLSDEQKAKLKNYHLECIKETGVNPDLVTKARNGEFADDEKFKNHLFCVSKKVGFQNEAGDIQEDVIRTKLNAEIKDLDITNKLIAKCALKKATPAQTAYDTIVCYYNATPHHISIV